MLAVADVVRKKVVATPQTEALSSRCHVATGTQGRRNPRTRAYISYISFSLRGMICPLVYICIQYHLFLARTTGNEKVSSLFSRQEWIDSRDLSLNEMFSCLFSRQERTDSRTVPDGDTDSNMIFLRYEYYRICFYFFRYIYDISLSV